MAASNDLPDMPHGVGRGKRWCSYVCTGFLVYFFTSFITLMGVSFGTDYVIRRHSVLFTDEPQFTALCRWDGTKYATIAKYGYQYKPNQPSNVAFFPAFPLFGRAVTAICGFATELSLLIVAHISLVGAFVLWVAYLNERQPKLEEDVKGLAVLAFGLWPMTVFFRMAYSEPLFVVGSLLAFYGLDRRLPLWLVAVLIGAVTATRPVGICLVPMLGLEVWRRSASKGKCLLQLAWVLPVSCWGLASFMVFQGLVFDDPLAFLRTQGNYALRPPVPLFEKARLLLTLEPLWIVFDDSSPCYWARAVGQSNPVFNLSFANPFFFLSAMLLLFVGARWRLLTSNEILFSSTLLLIPYLTRSHEMCFRSMGRFTAVAFPLYLVMGHLLSRLPLYVSGTLLGVSGFGLGTFAALFAAAYPVY